MGLIVGLFVHNIRPQQLSLHKEQVRSDYWPSGLQLGYISCYCNDYNMGLIFGSIVHNIRPQQLSLHKEQVRSDYWPSGLQ